MINVEMMGFRLMRRNMRGAAWLAAAWLAAAWLAVLGCAALAGCAPAPAPVPSASPVKYASASAIVSVDTQTLSPDEMRTVADTHADGAYVLGPDDVVSVSVYLHPELDVPGATNSGGNIQGALITSDGTVELPLIGGAHLGGLTLPEAQDTLRGDYAQYVNDPKVAVELTEAQSLRYYLLGAFTTPGLKYPVHELTLLEALALGGSVDIASADLYQAYVAQGAVKLPVDLYALLVEGDLSQNILLASGDAIVIPTNANENAFVFGAVTKPGAVTFESGGLSLLQALSGAGTDLTALTNGRLSNVHIIRAHGRSAQFLVVDATMIMAGKATPFALEPGDIVFVPPTGIATWNQALDELLPSLQTVSDILNPFVSIKYLQRN